MTKNSLRRIPILNKTLKTVESNTESFGIQEALRRLSQDVNTKLSFNMPRATRKVLEEGRVILIGNHPTDTEPFALFACLPPRRDAKLIVSDCMVNLSQVIDEHLIPVHVRVDQIHAPVGWRPTAFLAHATSQKKHWTSQEAHEFNVAQMRRASRELSRGSLLMIFPGIRAKDRRWFPGVGHLLADTQTRAPIYVVNAHVRGTSHWDIARLLPLAGKLMPPIHVEFSRPVKVNTLRKKAPREIANVLEDKYEAWVKTLALD